MKLALLLLAAFLAEAEPKLRAALKLTEGYSLGFGGQFKNLVEAIRRLATVVIGGIITSTCLTLVLLPVLYEWVERNRPFDSQGVGENRQWTQLRVCR